MPLMNHTGQNLSAFRTQAEVFNLFGELPPGSIAARVAIEPSHGG